MKYIDWKCVFKKKFLCKNFLEIRLQLTSISMKTSVNIFLKYVKIIRVENLNTNNV